MMKTILVQTVARKVVLQGLTRGSFTSPQNDTQCCG